MTLRALRRLGLFSLASGLLVLSSASCTESRPGAAGSGSGSSSTSGGTSSSGGSATGDGGGGCASIAVAQLGEIVNESVDFDSPAFFGGTLTAGTYVLRDMFVLGTVPPDAGEDDLPPPSGPTGKTGRGTLVVTASTLTFVGARGGAASLPADEATRIDYKVNGTDIAGDETCPGPTKVKSFAYSAVGKQLSLRIDATHREVYLRVQP